MIFSTGSGPAGLESSPPVVSPPSAPVFHDLSEQLLYMNPHHQVTRPSLPSVSLLIFLNLVRHSSNLKMLTLKIIWL